jgi:hypothetical protein
MTASVERKMMLGTEHKLDYLILKERDGTGLAIKPVYAANSKYGLCIALKVRVAKMPSQGGGGGKNWQALWPEFKWVAVDKSRASTTITRFSGCTTNQLGEAIENFGDYVNSLVEYLDKTLEGLDHDKADAVAFISSAVLPVWQAAFEAMVQSATDKCAVDLTKVYPHHELPGYVSNQSVESVGGSTKAANEAAYAKFKVIEGGKTKGKPEFEDDEDDTYDAVEDEFDESDPDNE